MGARVHPDERPALTVAESDSRSSRRCSSLPHRLKPTPIPGSIAQQSALRTVGLFVPLRHLAKDGRGFISFEFGMRRARLRSGTPECVRRRQYRRQSGNGNGDLADGDASTHCAANGSACEPDAGHASRRQHTCYGRHCVDDVPGRNDVPSRHVDQATDDRYFVRLDAIVQTPGSRSLDHRHAHDGFRKPTFREWPYAHSKCSSRGRKFSVYSDRRRNANPHSNKSAGSAGERSGGTDYGDRGEHINCLGRREPRPDVRSSHYYFHKTDRADKVRPFQPQWVSSSNDAGGRLDNSDCAARRHLDVRCARAGSGVRFGHDISDIQ
jgi:hypothetical protein